MAPLETNGVRTDGAQPAPQERPADPSKAFDGLIKEYLVEYFLEAHCYPALRFKQGKRTMLQINVSASDLLILLQAKPSDDKKNDPHSGKNRPIVKGHAEEIRDYIAERLKASKPWILGTLTANVAEDKVKIIEFGKGVCLVVIPKGVFLDITDGQHRISAIRELMTNPDYQNFKHLISNDSFPISLVLEGDHCQCQTDFRDMAQSSPLPKSLLVSFGALGRDGITKELVKIVPMFRGKTQAIKSSPGSRSGFIYTINYIAKAVSSALANDPNDRLLDYGVKASAEALANCFNQFFSQCEDTKQIFEKEKLETKTFDEASSFRETCLLGTSVGLEILGRLLHCAYDKESNSFDAAMVSELANLDWSRKNELWKDNVVRYTESEDPAKRYKIATGASAVSDAVTAAKYKLSWQESEASAPMETMFRATPHGLD